MMCPGSRRSVTPGCQWYTVSSRSAARFRPSKWATRLPTSDCQVEFLGSLMPKTPKTSRRNVEQSNPRIAPTPAVRCVQEPKGLYQNVPSRIGKKSLTDCVRAHDTLQQHEVTVLPACRNLHHVPVERLPHHGNGGAHHEFRSRGRSHRRCGHNQEA